MATFCPACGKVTRSPSGMCPECWVAVNAEKTTDSDFARIRSTIRRRRNRAAAAAASAR